MKEADASARAEWSAFTSAGGTGRSGLPAFRAILRDYASHRYGPDVVAATRSLVRCRTYDRPGTPASAHPEFLRARAIVDSIGRVHDFEVTTLVDGLVMEISTGSGPDTLGLWGHLDVVPADSTGWTFDPWSADIVDGALRGRGAQDNKGPLMAMLFAIRALRDTGVPLTSRIVLFAGFAEETTFDDINGYLKEKRPPSRNVVIDSEFPVVIGEKGITWIRISSHFDRMPKRVCPEGFRIDELTGGDAPNQVPAHARIRLFPIKRPMSRALFLLKRKVDEFNVNNSRSSLTARAEGTDVVIEAAGRAAHGSTPAQGHNAAMDVVQFTYELASTCHSPAHWIVWMLGEFIQTETSGRGLGIARRDSLMGPTTVNVGMIGSNFDSAFVVLDIRHPPGLTSDQILKTIRERIEPFNARYEAGLRVEREGAGLDPVLVDPETPLVRNLIAAYQEVYGREGKALTSAGTTYAKKLPGAVSFGPAHHDEPGGAHAADELIPLAELDSLVRVYATAVLGLAAP